jgi:hypothetical protein
MAFVKNACAGVNHSKRAKMGLALLVSHFINDWWRNSKVAAGCGYHDSANPGVGGASSRD